MAIAVGGGHALALRADGRVMVWGDNSVGQLEVPSDLTNAVAIAAGNCHSRALTAVGSVVAWGDNIYGQTDVPAGIGKVRAVAAGLPLTYQWYFNEEPLPGATNSTLTLDAVRFLQTGRCAVTAANDHGSVRSAEAELKATQLLAWGDNHWGQTNVPPVPTHVVDVSANGNYSLALRPDGKVMAWGDTDDRPEPVPAGLDGLVAVSAGVTHDVGLREDGTVVAWGSNTAGQTGASHQIVLHNDGTPAAWGENAHGEIDIPTGITNVADVAAGSGFSVVLAGPVRLLSGRHCHNAQRRMG